jgi:hypothetical protein
MVAALHLVRECHDGVDQRMARRVLYKAAMTKPSWPRTSRQLAECSS